LRSIDRGEGVEPEDYLNVALTEWLPRRWDDANYDRALGVLAVRFVEQHGDRWLQDVLAAKRSEGLAVGLSTLAESVEANGADDPDRGLEEATAAAPQLRAAGSEAAALQADFEGTYARHRSMQSAAECVEKAVALEQQTKLRKYLWIRAQAILEQGNCRSLLGDSGPAHRDLARALELIREIGYRDLELRASGILANAQTFDGNLKGTWNIGRTVLAKYWTGPYSGVRAQQIYFNFVLSAEGLGLRQAALVMQREAARRIAETPRRRIEARARAHLAELAMGIGRSEEAKAEFDRAAALFADARGPSDREFRSRAELYRAQAEVAAGSPQAAIERMNSARASVEKSGAVMDRISFQELLGDSLRSTGRPNEAEAVYRQAIGLTEVRLSTHPGVRDRAQLLVGASRAYRGLLEILWERGDQSGALRLWEWFRAGERSERRAESDFDQRRLRLRDESFLSYVVVPGSVYAWLFDEHNIQSYHLKVTPGELEAVASRFLRECADAASDLRAVQRDARQLYDSLLAPLADHLDPARTLVIEPDGPVGAIPMQALMDENSRYLGERFAITVSNGLADYQNRKRVGPVNADLNALVVTNPALGEETAKTFPPLAGTMREGQSVAKRFRTSALVTGPGANLTAVEQHRPAAELFHFSGHGFSNGGNGGLLLSPDEKDSDGAGVLDGTRLANQDWSRCRLAVLAACSAGTGEAGESVNPESLVRGFLWAGVARVVASRWNMDTETGALFMNQFYSELLSQADVAAALQSAARRLRGNKPTSHPYYWAGFQCFGAR
jgi:CHAT domain-containing protein